MPANHKQTQCDVFNHQRAFDVSIFQNPETRQLLDNYNRLIKIREDYTSISPGESDEEIAKKLEERKHTLRQLNAFATDTYHFLQACQKNEVGLKLLQQQVADAKNHLDAVTRVKNRPFTFEADGLGIVAIVYWSIGLLVSCTLVLASVCPFFAPILMLGMLVLFSTPTLIPLASDYYDHRQSVKKATQDEQAAQEAFNRLTKEQKAALINVSTMTMQGNSFYNSRTFFPELPKPERHATNGVLWNAHTQTEMNEADCDANTRSLSF